MDAHNRQHDAQGLWNGDLRLWWPAMAQYAVYPNPSARSREQVPDVVAVQLAAHAGGIRDALAAVISGV